MLPMKAKFSIKVELKMFTPTAKIVTPCHNRTTHKIGSTRTRIYWSQGMDQPREF